APACLGSARRRPLECWTGLGRLEPWRSVQPLAGREPSRALGAEFPHCSHLVLCDLLRGEGLRPAAVHPLMNEDLGTGVPECATQGHTLGGMLLHPSERAIFQN